MHIRLRGDDDRSMVFELDTRPIQVLKVTERGSGRGGEMELVWAGHMRVRAERKVRTVDRQWFRVERISTGREGGVMLRSHVDFFSVLTDAGVGIATYHGRVVPLVRMRREGSLNIVGSPGHVSP